jgi:hypothetical protein
MADRFEDVSDEPITFNKILPRFNNIVHELGA